MHDWALLARLATGLLAWPPDVFWRSTPVELASALRGRLGERIKAGAPLKRVELQRLQAHLKH
ncbi:MAG: hypothetical protein Tsb0016_27120 [Sphingomonadales bacterium]